MIDLIMKNRLEPILDTYVWILDVKWRFIVKPHKLYKKEQGGDSSGTTEKDIKEIYIDESHIKKKLFTGVWIIFHELGHAYFAEKDIESANLQTWQLEEVACDMYFKHSIKMMKQACELMKQTKIYEDEDIDKFLSFLYSGDNNEYNSNG